MRKVEIPGEEIVGGATASDGHTLVLGTSSGQVWFADARDASVTRGSSTHAGSVQGLAAAPAGGLAATWSADQTFYLWDVVSRRMVYSLHGWMIDLGFSATGRQFAALDQYGQVRVWALE